MAFTWTIMYYSVLLIVLGFLLGTLGLSMGLPFQVSYGSHDSHSPRRYNPQDFYASGRFHAQEISERIVGGWDAPEGFASHKMALIIGESVKLLMCGGFLVSDRCALTAAHCTDALEWWAVPGTLMPTTRGQIGSNSLIQDYDVVEFSKYLNHPAWDRENIKSDLSVLWLTEKLPKNSLVKPITLSFKRIGGGHRLTATDWGTLTHDGELPTLMQKLEVYSLTYEACKEGVNEAEDEFGYAPPLDDEVEMCTLHTLGAGQGMCNGDSGSALIKPQEGKVQKCKKGEKCENGQCVKCKNGENCVKRELCKESGWEAVGVVSWGFPCARGYPDMFVRISAFKEFLLHHVGLSAGDYEE